MFIVHIAGHLGKDPEVRFTANGLKVTTFVVATNQRKGKEDVTVWVRVTVWGERFDKMIAFLKKGSAVIVSGKMSPPSTYVDREGRTQVSLEMTAEMIEFSPFGKSDRGEGQSGTQQNNFQQPQGYGNEEPSYARNAAPQQPKVVAESFSGHAVGHASDDHLVDEDSLPF